MGNIEVFQPSSDAFVKSMASSDGVICGAGFETPSEAIFMGKKLLVIPMKSQYEQHCNAAALAEMNVSVMNELSTNHIPEIKNWIENGIPLHIKFPDECRKLVHTIVRDYQSQDISELYLRPMRQQIRQIPSFG